MAYVVTDLCNDCKYTSCVAVCPVEAFHEGPDRLFINPETCIDCNACVPECPVDAIFPDYDVPEKYEHNVEENASEAEKYEVIVEIKDPLKGPKCVDPDADQ
ncbi:MAG: 4Fe-4S binding protein [Opitutales bacterium]|nr:4Fe-4S binding protein [Opitutales bacterium]MCH8541294.1 ferredoxin family protein [Opitutales bacterium]